MWQRLSESSWTQRTPAGLPPGMPGIGEEIEGAMQHAPHPGLHSMSAEYGTVGSVPFLHCLGAMRAPMSIECPLQLIWLAVLGLVVACLSWTVTHEEIAREPREYCQRRGREDPRPPVRKSFYVFTCEYCFSHWVTLGVVALTGFRLLLDDWRGYLLSIFATVAVANFCMSAFGRLRQEVKSEGLEAKRKEQAIERSRQLQSGEEEEGGRRPGLGAGAQRPAAGSPGPRSAPEPWPPSASASKSAPGSGSAEWESGIATKDG